MSEVAKVREAYLLDTSVSHVEYGRMIAEAAERDRIAEAEAERPERELHPEAARGLGGTAPLADIIEHYRRVTGG